MPFLFVDYDHGAGGEFFCANLSRSPECVTLDYHRDPVSHRTKVQDIFEQEFLKPCPDIRVVSSDQILYDVVPCHRHTELARQMLGNIRTIRIQNPGDPDQWRYIIEQRINKVLLIWEPNDLKFLGWVKAKMQQTGNRAFVKQVRRCHDNLDITLLSEGIALSDINRQTYLERMRSQPPESNPDAEDYDLVIAYEDLMGCPDQVAQEISQEFRITISDPWLEHYRHSYETFLAPA